MVKIVTGRLITHSTGFHQQGTEARTTMRKCLCSDAEYLKMAWDSSTFFFFSELF